MKQSLTKKVFFGGFWYSFLRVLSNGISLLRTIILARLLTPEHFGLMAVVMLSINFLYQFSKTGIGMALIQKKGQISDYYDTSLIISIVRGVIIFCPLFFGADLIAGFFENNKIAILLQVVAFSPLILSFASPKIIKFERDLDFSKRFWYELTATIVDMIVAISLAFILRNVWALILGLIAGDLTRLFLSYVMFPYVPSFKFDKEKAKDLFHFGKWIFIGTILNFSITRLPDLFVGKLLGMGALGVYQMAFRMSNIISSDILNIFYKVTFPAFSTIQHDIKRLRTAFLRVLQLSSLILTPLCLMTILLAKDFTVLFLGEKWLAIILPTQILAVMALFYSFTAAFGSVYLCLGYPDIPTKFQVIRLAILGIFMYPLTVKFHVIGASVALLGSVFFTMPSNIFSILKLIDCPVRLFLSQFFVSIVSGISMIVAVLMARSLLGPGAHIVKFFLVGALGVIAYLASIYVMDSIYGYGFKKILKVRHLKDFLKNSLKDSNDDTGDFDGKEGFSANDQ